MDLYRQYRDENRAFWDDERVQNDTAGKVAGVVGNIPIAIASSALPGGPIAQGALTGGLTGLDQSRADLTKGEFGRAAKDTVTGAAIGAGAAYAIPKVIGAVAKPIQKAGEALQVPQRAKDALGGWLGSSRVGKWLAGAADDQTDDVLKSARVKDLEFTISDSDKLAQEVYGDVLPLPDEGLTPRLARASNQGRADLSPDGSFAVDPAEFGDDFAKIQAEVIEEAAKRHYPGVSTAEAGPGIGTLDAVKVASMKAANAAPQAAKRVAQDMPTNAGAMAPASGDVSMSSIRQVNQLAKPSGYDKHWLPSKMEGPKAQAIEAEIRAAMPNATDDEIRSELMQALYPDSEWGRLRMRQGNFENSRAAPPSSGVSPALEESIRNRAFKKDVTTGIQDEERALINQAIALKEKIAQSDAMAAEKFVTDTAEANRLKSVADGARQELERITTGNRAIGKVLGGVAGAKAGMAIGGLPGAALGASAGAAGGSKLLQGVDLAGGLGQRLARVSSSVDQLALRDDSVGAMARWALSGEGGSQVARMLVLAGMPEAQEAMGMEQ
jgi:hypothetical protein